MIIASHRRSGTHLLINSFFLSYGHFSRWRYKLIKTHAFPGEISDGSARMEVAEARQLKLLTSVPKQPIVYVVRDPRDSLASCYRWWKQSGESKAGGIAAHFENLSPAEYLRGGCTLKTISSPNPWCGVTPQHIGWGILSDPVAFWARQTAGFLDAGITTVRFEDLLADPESVMRQVADTFGIRPPRKARLPDGPVGHRPGKGLVGGHTSLFDSDAIALIESQAGSMMQKLGYL